MAYREKRAWSPERLKEMLRKAAYYPTGSVMKSWTASKWNDIGDYLYLFLHREPIPKRLEYVPTRELAALANLAARVGCEVAEKL